MTARVNMSCPVAGDTWCFAHDVTLLSEHEASWDCFTCAEAHSVPLTPVKWYELRLAGAVVQ